MDEIWTTIKKGGNKIGHEIAQCGVIGKPSVSAGILVCNQHSSFGATSLTTTEGQIV